eukprot:c21604_g1_i1.p1 GENE.c21604_g1_i1~~c21604_g1_i1.p1  ORF type:complete len:507 (+),score=50.08 c21604_g1_i1:35-1522(+)
MFWASLTPATQQKLTDAGYNEELIRSLNVNQKLAFQEGLKSANIIGWAFTESVNYFDELHPSTANATQAASGSFDQRRGTKRKLDIFPQMITGNATKSMTPRSNHARAEITEKVFNFFDEELEIPAAGLTLQAGMPQIFNNEDDVKYYVRCLLNDVIKLTGLDLQITSELTMLQMRSDLWVLTKNNVPVTIIEVKLPNKEGVSQKPRIAGQLLDYMLRLKLFYGVEDVFGLISTYNEWRVFWLPSPRTDEVAAFTHPNQASTLHSPEVSIDEVKRNKASRKITCGKPFSITDPNIWKLLTTVVKKAYNTGHKNVSTCYCIMMIEGGWDWAIIPSAEAEISPPTGVVEKYYLVQELGYGTDGKAWKAVYSQDSKTKICVIKFSSSEKIKSEKEAYDKISIPTFEVTLNRNPALVMPLFTVIDSWDDMKTKVQSYLSDLLINKKVIHLDIDKRHFFYQDKKKDSLVLIDWVRWKDVETEDNTASILTNQMKLLFEEE